jgi:hypothetical protein
MGKSYEEWVALYEDKTGDEHTCPEGFTTLYDAEKGYAQYRIDGNRLHIYECCGDGRYWYDVGIKICRDYNIEAIITICTRKIEPYIRSMKFKIKKRTLLPHRHNGYRYEGCNHLGKPLFIFPAWWDYDKNMNAYYVVSFINEVNKDEIQPANV